MKQFFTARLGLTIALVVGLQACGAEPTGQVVAVVNGEEITQGELNAEIAELPSNVRGDEDTVRREVLSKIIERRLVAQLAKEEGLNRDPTYLMRERRLREELLVQLYGQRQADTVRIPDSVAVKKFVTDNPDRFLERTSYQLDQIVFDLTTDKEVLEALEGDNTLEQVEKTLERFGIEYDRIPNQIDSITVPTPILEQIGALPDGEPFVLPADGRLTVSVIIGKALVPTAEDEVVPIAAQELRTTKIRELLEGRLEEARAKADIAYQDGLGPTEIEAPNEGAD